MTSTYGVVRPLTVDEWNKDGVSSMHVVCNLVVFGQITATLLPSGERKTEQTRVTRNWHQYNSVPFFRECTRFEIKVNDTTHNGTDLMDTWSSDTMWHHVTACETVIVCDTMWHCDIMWQHVKPFDSVHVALILTFVRILSSYNVNYNNEWQWNILIRNKFHSDSLALMTDAN